ncbi:MAG: T9SS type A sorting domain-containing protein [Flavobacteriales bacterium]|nr:T9SS type A sorting domain-containing protein [Flavobacteriales bacterium]
MTDPGVYDVVVSGSLSGNLSSGRIRHVVVDMAGNNGLGIAALDTTWAPADSVMPNFASTVHSNGSDYWYVKHLRSSNQFKAWRVTPTSVDTVGVISAVGVTMDHYFLGAPYYTMLGGAMVFNLAGDRLFMSTTVAPHVYNDSLLDVMEMFSFDQGSGVLQRLYGIAGRWRAVTAEFSPDGSKLYVVSRDTTAQYMEQFDISSGDSTLVQTSRTIIHQASQNSTTRQLRLGPDGRVYVSHGSAFGQNWMGCITQPDQAGLGCAYIDSYIDLLPHFPITQLPTMLKRYHDSELILDAPAREYYANHLQIWPNPAGTSAWVKLPEGVESELLIMDAVGRAVRVVKPNSFMLQWLDLQDLSAGTYLVSAWAGEQSLGTARLVLER